MKVESKIRVKTHTFMTNYNKETFEKKRQKGERLTYDKIPLATTDVVINAMTKESYNSDLDELNKSNFNPLEFTYKKGTEHYEHEKKYCYLRLNEWLVNTSTILNRRLIPGFSKNGKLQLVGIDWRILDFYFCKQKCVKSKKTYRPFVNRERVDVPYYSYDFTELPDFGNDDWWIVCHEPNEEFDNYSESYYTRLKFTICTATNRMWCEYWQVSCTESGKLTA